MKPPVAAPRQHSVDSRNTQIIGNPQITQQTAIKTEMVLWSEIMAKLTNSQNKDSEKVKKLEKPKSQVSFLNKLNYV